MGELPKQVGLSFRVGCICEHGGIMVTWWAPSTFEHYHDMPLIADARGALGLLAFIGHGQP